MRKHALHRLLAMLIASTLLVQSFAPVAGVHAAEELDDDPGEAAELESIDQAVTLKEAHENSPTIDLDNAIAFEKSGQKLELPENIDVELEKGLRQIGARLFTAPFSGELKKKLHDILNRLKVPGDASEYKIKLSLSPLPNAYVILDKGEIGITVGLLASTKNVDELASVIAHEMTHDNPQHLAAQQDSDLVKNTFESIGKLRNLEPNQREEIRADLGAIERLIKGGFNPWAFYDWQRRFEEAMKYNFEDRLGRKLLKVIFKKSATFHADHPKGEIRMAAAKNYILKKGFKTDISEQVAKYEPFNGALKSVRARAMIYSKPFFSKTAFRVQNAIFVTALASVFSSDIANAVSNGLGYFWSNIVPDMPTVGSGGKISYLFDGIWNFIKVTAPIVATIKTYKGIKSIAKESATPRERKEIEYVIKELRGELKDYEKFKDKPMALADVQSALLKLRSLEGMELMLSEGDENRFDENYRRKQSPGYRSKFEKLRALLFTRRKAALDILRSYKTQLADLIIDQMERYPSEVKEGELLVLFSEHPTDSYLLERQPEFRQRLYKLVQLGDEDLKIDLDSTHSRRSYFVRSSIAPLYHYDRGFTDLNPDQKVKALLDLMEGGFGKMAYRELIKDWKNLIEWTFPPKGNTEPISPERAKNFANLLTKVVQNHDRYGYRDHALTRKHSFAIERKLLLERGKRLASDDVSQLAIKLLGRETPFTGRLFNIIDAGFSTNLSERTALRYWIQRKDDAAITKFFEARFNSVEGLVRYVDNIIEKRGILGDAITENLNRAMANRPDLIQSEKDIELVLSRDYFWPKQKNDFIRYIDKDSGDVELPLLRKIQQTVVAAGADYNIAASERLQKTLVERTSDLDGPAKEISSSEWLNRFQKFSSRGVTSSSDTFFLKAVENSTIKDLPSLSDKNHIVRIFDPETKRQLARKIHFTDEKIQAIRNSSGEARKWLIRDTLGHLSSGFPGRGIQYSELLEEFSGLIASTRLEAAVIQGHKTYRTGEQSEDIGLRALGMLLETAHKKSKSNQWDVIRYLRGDIPPTPLIQNVFQQVGPERIQQLFLNLAPEIRAGLLDAFLDSPKGLLPTQNMTSGWGKTMIEHVLRSDSKESKRVASEVLDSMMYALKKTGNKALQSYIVAYLLGLPSSQLGPGQSLKHVLESFGVMGVKLGQFLAASEILPDAEAEPLRELTDRARRPVRTDMYRDLEAIGGKKYAKTELGKLLGSASLKYAAEFENEDGITRVAKVLREESLAHTKMEFKLLEHMATYLSKKHGPKYGVFRSIVRATRQAVERELVFADEVARGKKARETIYAPYSTPNAEGVSFAVPEEKLVGQRLIDAELARGVSFRELPEAMQAKAAAHLLEVETRNLFSENNAIVFDPDRHLGNYRYEVYSENGTEKLRIWPIDFGQLSEVSLQERGKVLDLFALSQIVKETGSTKWAADQAKQTLSLTDAQAATLKKSMSKYFPTSGGKEMAAYYSLLAALDDAGKTMDIVYFDFLRGLVQLQQYQKYLPKESKALRPRQRFTELVKANASRMLEGHRMTTLEKLSFLKANLGEIRSIAKKENCSYQSAFQVLLNNLRAGGK